MAQRYYRYNNICIYFYFDMASKQKVVSQLYDSLTPGGYFFIGYSESLHGISKSFKLVHYPKVMVYQKEGTPLT